jgi:UDP-N-acetylmuramyl tripeptide synthase
MAKEDSVPKEVGKETLPAVEQPKFIAFFEDAEGKIQFNLNGLNADEALLIAIKGVAKYQKTYEAMIRQNS